MPQLDDFLLPIRATKDGIPIAPMEDWEALRRRAALECLLVMLENGGDRRDKINAAVEYANLLVEKLQETEQR